MILSVHVSFVKMLCHRHCPLLGLGAIHTRNYKY